MKTYYCVTSSFDNNGHATAAITNTVKADRKPAGCYTSTRSIDIYLDWFDTRKAAEKFVRETLEA